MKNSTILFYGGLYTFLLFVLTFSSYFILSMYLAGLSFGLIIGCLLLNFRREDVKNE
jgi:hypothetical protein